MGRIGPSIYTHISSSAPQWWEPQADRSESTSNIQGPSDAFPCRPTVVSAAPPYALVGGRFATVRQVPWHCWATGFREPSDQPKTMRAVMTRPLDTALRPKYHQGLLEEDDNTVSQRAPFSLPCPDVSAW